MILTAGGINFKLQYLKKNHLEKVFVTRKLIFLIYFVEWFTCVERNIVYLNHHLNQILK